VKYLGLALHVGDCTATCHAGDCMGMCGRKMGRGVVEVCSKDLGM